MGEFLVASVERPAEMSVETASGPFSKLCAPPFGGENLTKERL